MQARNPLPAAACRGAVATAFVAGALALGKDHPQKPWSECRHSLSIAAILLLPLLLLLSVFFLFFFRHDPSFFGSNLSTPVYRRRCDREELSAPISPAGRAVLLAVS